MKYIYTYSGILLFLSFVLILFWVYPQYQKSLALSKEINYWQKLLNNRESYLEQLKELDKKLEENKKVKKVDTALPLDEPVSEIFRFLQQKAEATGVFISDINFTTSQPTLSSPDFLSVTDENLVENYPNFSQPVFSESASGSFSETIDQLTDSQQSPLYKIKSKYSLEKVELKFSLKGSYNAIKNFMKELEKNIRLVNIQSFSISSSGKEGETSNFLKAEFSISVYRYHYLNQ
jgi:Tfp pilus assembly protein PilO